MYGMLRLRVEVAVDGTMVAQGILSENVCVQHEDGRPASEEGFCENGLASLCTISSDCTESGKPRRAKPLPPSSLGKGSGGFATPDAP